VTDQNPLPISQRVGITLTTFLRALVRVLLVILAAIILGGLIYLGFVGVYQQAVLPARENDSRISLLLEQRLEAFQARLTVLESEHKLSSESLDELATRQEQLQAEIDQQAIELQRLDDLQADLENIRSYADKAYNLSIQSYQATVGKDSVINALERQIEVLKVAGLLNRSRLYMVQSNFGLARDQVMMARELLGGLLEFATDTQRPVLSAWIGRLDSALDNLPGSPVLAADELEIAWRQILLGLPEQSIITPTPYIYRRSITPTAFPTYTVTPLQETYTPTVFLQKSGTPSSSPTAYQTPTPK
jgi:hypothetical protein